MLFLPAEAGANNLDTGVLVDPRVYTGWVLLRNASPYLVPPATAAGRVVLQEVEAL